MKKTTIILIILAITIIILVQNKTSQIIIPNESIRIRIIPNSNKEIDILEKIKVKEQVEKEIYLLLDNVYNIDEARKIINDNLERLNITIDNTTNQKFNVNFGSNYFPNKIHNNIIYNEGLYESLVITLGEGAGDNWWCVLFPPLCLLDSEKKDTNDVEYRFWVLDLFDKYY